MTQELAVVRAHSQELQTMDTPLSPMEVLKQVNLIQEVMKVAMKEGEHYGTIPGCPKPCLYQSGAEKLKLTFRFRDTYPRIERIDLPGGHREYIVTCALSTMSGVVLGEAPPVLRWRPNIALWVESGSQPRSPFQRSIGISRRKGDTRRLRGNSEALDFLR
jgi:hypothetical protein